MTIQLAGVPHLLTERLDLRLPVAADLQPMRAIVTDDRTRRYLGPPSDPADHFQRFSRNAGSWLVYGYGSFMVRLRGSEALIGNCGVFHSWRGLGEDFDDAPEAGWILRHDHVGKGLGFEAMSAALAWFDGEHGPRRVVCMISVGNEPSIALAGKLGFAPMRDTVLPDGDAVTLFERVPA